MKVLAVRKNKFQLNELNEFFANATVLTATSDKSAIEKLEKNKFDIALINIKSNSDFGLIKYINDNFKKTRVIITISNELQDLLSIILSGKFTTINKPLKLKQLKEILN